MDRVAFDLMSYPVQAGPRTRSAFTFNPGTSGARTVGRIVAPPGSELRRGPGPVKLCVPKPNKVREFDVLGANDALDAAKAGKYGLAFEPDGVR